MELLDPEIEPPLKRRRGPKPLSLRAKFAATAWLDAEILWRDGRVIWRLNGRELEIGPRELDATSRALLSLGRHPKAARRHHADFDVWHARRLQQFQKANRLAMLRASDLDALTSPSRRRNPAALERLVALLAVEISVAEPLLHSPARALFEAWPLSATPLKQWQQTEFQPLEASALAALIVGAAEPLGALPGEPWLRRAARYGARFGFPRAPGLVVSLLQSGGRDGEMSVWRIEQALENRAPFGFDAAQLLTLQRTGRDGAEIAELAETANRLEPPFLSLSFAPVTLKRFDAESQRALSACWRAARDELHAGFGGAFAHIAERGTPRDLELASELLNQLVAAPTRASGQLKIGRGRRARRTGEIPVFADMVTAALSRVAKNIQFLVAAPDLGILPLLLEVLEGRAPDIDPEASPAVWAQRWQSYVHQGCAKVASMLHLSAHIGVEATREALQLDCWRVLASQTNLKPELVQFALEVKAWAPEINGDTLHRLTYLAVHWSNAADARTAIFPLREALRDADPPARARWLSAVLDSIEWSKPGARRQLPALARFLPAMRRLEPLLDDDRISRWTLIEIALEMWAAMPERAAQSEVRFAWLAGEIARQLAADGTPKGWSRLDDLVALLSRLAPDDEPQFRALMNASWRFAAADCDLKWSEIKSGAKLARGFTELESALRDNFARCPARCFALLEQLGPLEDYASIRAPLEAWRERGQVAPAVPWPLELDDEMRHWAARLIAAQRELGEPETAPPGLLKIAAWPQKMEAEIAALRSRGELAPHLAKRLENLIERVEDRAALQAAMREEMLESLRNATVEAELRAAERAVENCYRARLEVLGAPKTLILDANWLNAALFSTDLELNRKWLREILRAEWEKRPDWRLEIEGNAQFLREMGERGLPFEQWLFEAPRTFLVENQPFEFRLESRPLHILQMGNYFGTCLSRGDINAHSSVANAVELNKRVVFLRDAKGRVVGRQLLALSSDWKLIGFHVYISTASEIASEIRLGFGQYASDFAARCGVKLADSGEISKLFVSDWYDDGAIAWADLAPQAKPKNQLKKEGKMSQKKPKTPILTGRDAHIARLNAGETVSFREGGNSMTPRIKSRQKCTYAPVHSLDDIRVGDAVFCRVGSSYFTHLVSAIQGERVQISNNHGHINGWTNLAHIYGKVVKIEN